MNGNCARQSVRAPRRRGSAYVMVLGVSTVLVVIGLSAVTVSRVQTRQITQAGNWNDAQILAFSGVEHALAKLNADKNWRSTFDGQNVQQSLGGGDITWNVSDSADGNLGDNPNDQATLNVTATAGGATYSLEVALTPGAGQSSGSGTGSTGSSGPSIKLWGINEDNNQLFSIDNYVTAPQKIVKYRRPLKWRSRGRIKNVWGDIEAMTIDSNGIMYVAIDQNMWPYRKPVLAKFDLADASTRRNNVVTVIGGIPSRQIVGLAIDPTTDILYGLARAACRQACTLKTINKATGAVVVELGQTVGLGKKVDRGEDIEFDESGNLYLSDDRDDYLYKVNKATGALIKIVDNHLHGGNHEALAWDAVHNRLLGSETGGRDLYHVTLENGNDVKVADFGRARLTDVEGMSFVPSIATSGAAVAPVATTTAIQRVVK